MSDPDCIFCAIVRGEAPVSIVGETETTLAFMDIRPVTPGHLLIVPKQHATYLADLSSHIAGQLMEAALPLAAALRVSGLRCDGVNLFLADGVAAGQEVFHVHLHVIPRFPGDGFVIDAAWGDAPTPRAELDATAATIGQAAATATR